MRYGRRANFEEIREVAFGSITANYTAVGAALNDYPRVISINNYTDAEVYISLDGTTNHLRMAANSYKTWDIETAFLIPKGKTFYIKRVNGGPSSGSVWIEVLVGKGGI